MQRSSTCQSGGKTPHWNDVFYFTIQGDPMLRAEVWDNDAVEDDLVGQGSYNLMPYLNNRIDTTLWVDLYYNGRNAGKLCLGLQFNPNTSMGIGMMGVNMGMGMMGPPMGGMGGMGPMGPMGGNMGGGWGGNMGGNMGGGWGGNMGSGWGNNPNNGGWGGMGSGWNNGW